MLAVVSPQRSGKTNLFERHIAEQIDRGLREFKTMEPQPEPQGFMDFRSLRPAGERLAPWLRTPTPAQITRVEATRNRAEPPPPPEPVRVMGFDIAERPDMFTIDSWVPQHTVGFGHSRSELFRGMYGGDRRSALYVPLEMSTRDVEERLLRFQAEQSRSRTPHPMFFDYETSLVPSLRRPDYEAQERARERIRTFAERYSMGDARVRDLHRHRDVNDPSTHDISARRHRLGSVFGTVTGRTSSGGPDMQTIRRSPASPIQRLASTLAEMARSDAFSELGRAYSDAVDSIMGFGGDERFDQLRAEAAQRIERTVQPVAYAVPISISDRRPINLEVSEDDRQRAEFLARNARNETERAVARSEPVRHVGAWTPRIVV